MHDIDIMGSQNVVFRQLYYYFRQWYMGMFAALETVSMPGNSKGKIIILLLLYKKILGKWPFMAIVKVVFFNLGINDPDFMCFNRLTFSKNYENYTYNWKWMIYWFSHKKINGN